jgi:hypothetical protein
MALTKISRGLLSTGISDSSDATAITIDSSERVLLQHTTSIANASLDDLEIGSGSGNAGMTIYSGTSGFGGLAFADGNTGASDQYPGLIEFSHSANSMHFYTANTERMRIDSNGTVLVGKTAEGTATDGIELNRNDVIVATRDGDAPLILNRRTSDGDIALLRKDNSTVGSIGANGGRPYLVNNVDGGIHVATDGYGRALLLPADQTGSPEDNLHYLGSSSYRWRDIYLSNAAYLGGTATANALDDYEEGTWTPSVNAGAISGTSISYSGTYTKIGRLVFISFVATNSAADINVSSYVQFSGVPFTIANIGTSSVMTEDPDQFDRHGFAELGSTFLTLTNSGSSSGTSTLKVGIVGSTS